MTIEQAIVKAYEAGWRHKAWPNMKPKTIKEDMAHALWYGNGNGFLLDPLFWKSLGKAMGWGNRVVTSEQESLRIMHTFIDWSWQGGEIEEFFEELSLPESSLFQTYDQL